MGAARLNRLRRALSAALLAVVAAAEVGSLRTADLLHRIRMLARYARGEPVPLSERMGFIFDPVYADFLREVARRTPRDATVAVLVQRIPDVYRYQAAYVLAPRRVVEADEIGEAQFVAVYGPERARWPGGTALPGGTLEAR